MSTNTSRNDYRIGISLIALIIGCITSYVFTKGTLWLLDEIFDVLYGPGPGNIGLWLWYGLAMIVVSEITLLLSVLSARHLLGEKLLEKTDFKATVKDTVAICVLANIGAISYILIL